MAISGMEQDAITARLDAIIRDVVPAVATVPKYGGTLYTLRPDQKEGQFCGVFPYKDHVQLAFSQGILLRDPQGLLSGTGKFRRHINIADPHAINARAFAALVAEAVQVSENRR